MKFARSLFTIYLLAAMVIMMTASCSKSDEVGTPEKAKQILEKSFQKYSELTKKEGRDVRSVVAKAIIKGRGQLPLGGGSGNMPMNVDAAVEIYAAKPRNLYLDISGNLGNAKIIIVEKEQKATVTVILPATKQFAIMDMPEQVVKKTQPEGAQKPETDQFEEFLKQASLEYGGTEGTKAGKAHKIIIRSNKPEDKGVVTAYILDRKWDPQRIEIASGEGGLVTVEFEKLELNVDIPDKKFVPDTQGYTQVNNQQLMSVIMMQLMAGMMQPQQQPQQPQYR